MDTDELLAKEYLELDNKYKKLELELENITIRKHEILKVISDIGIIHDFIINMQRLKDGGLSLKDINIVLTN